MQKLYDIEVLYQATLEMEFQGKNIEVLDYVVRYKIMENNGTFRKGLPSDVWKPQHYLVSYIDGELKILNIIDIKFHYIVIFFSILMSIYISCRSSAGGPCFCCASKMV